MKPRWITPTVDDPPPVDVPILAQLYRGGVSACSVAANGDLWQDAPYAGSVAVYCADDILRYCPLADVLAAIGGGK